MSEFDWKMAPSRSISCRSSSALVRLPLWAMAMGPRAVLGRDGLGVAQVGAARRRVADVADGARAREPAEPLGAEHVGHPAHGLLRVKARAVGGRDAGRLLPAMLEGIETEVGHIGGLGMVPDAEQPAFVVELVVTPRDVQIRSSTRSRVDPDPRPRPFAPPLSTTIRVPPVRPIQRHGIGHSP